MPETQLFLRRNYLVVLRRIVEGEAAARRRARSAPVRLRDGASHRRTLGARLIALSCSA